MQQIDLKPVQYQGYIFDLDGTIYLGDDLLPHAAEVITHIRTREGKVLFLSNNPTKTVDQYVTKLTALGIPATPADILTSLATTVHWLKTNHPHATVFPIGERPLIGTLRENNIRISENPAEIEIVIASYDRTFTYRKLQIAFDAIHVHRRAILVSTNPDRFCPFPGGQGEPDAAAIVGAIEGCTGLTCSAVFGKPEPIMLEAALARIGLPREDCLMVGDRLLTDIAMAHRAGMDSALVLTGDATRADLEELAEGAGRPTFVLDDLGQLLL